MFIREARLSRKGKRGWMMVARIVQEYCLLWCETEGSCKHTPRCAKRRGRESGGSLISVLRLVLGIVLRNWPDVALYYFPGAIRTCSRVVTSFRNECGENLRPRASRNEMLQVRNSFQNPCSRAVTRRRKLIAATRPCWAWHNKPASIRMECMMIPGSTY